MIKYTYKIKCLYNILNRFKQELGEVLGIIAHKIRFNVDVYLTSFCCGRVNNKWFIARTLSIPMKVHFRDVLTNEKLV